ncbi:hypothetical protein BDV29DRAFT_25293 [Aspergillus leporis]|jgi:hypothetical protein|uniref:Uncharacterized protein n=1 Tax=Aspergillus leporis TaxID=41062 RepID=A0A5N5XBE3_9EURO|nr:hypothetical protein BDV29DRAFT_25293 [Aspergillus leporis]
MANLFGIMKSSHVLCDYVKNVALFGSDQSRCFPTPRVVWIFYYVPCFVSYIDILIICVVWIDLILFCFSRRWLSLRPSLELVCCQSGI